MDTLWLVLAAVRVLWTLLPQTGFVYPDEFFQNPEVMAGNIFGFEVYIPWEYHNVFPCRNVVFPFLTSGIPFLILKTMRLFFPSIVTTYTLLVFPRICMLILSFIIDYCVYKSCKILNLNPKTSLVILASSFITLVFHCRTLSNTIESILFAILLTTVLTVRSKFTVCENTDRSDEDLSSIVRKSLAVLAAIVVFGFFNRPTFLLFAAWPLFYLFCVIVKRSSTLILNNMMPAVLVSAVSVCICVVADCLYFESGLLFVLLYGADFTLLGDILSNLVFTPLNFIAYNADKKNLLEHGINSHYTHLLVNIPILFLPIALSLLSNLLHSFRHSGLSLKSDRIVVFLVLCVATPVALLSMIPHQETRFLIPTLIPMCILFSKVNHSVSRFFKIAWILWNLIGCLGFGTLHEGGLVQSVDYARTLSMQNNASIYDFVFYHTHTPPKHLFAYNPLEANQNTGLSTNQMVRSPVMVHSIPHLNESFLDLTLDRLTSQHLPGEPYAIYLVAPATLEHQFCTPNPNYKLTLQHRFPLHFPFLDFPDFTDNVKCEGNHNQSISLTSIFDKFYLNLYKINPL